MHLSLDQWADVATIAGAVIAIIVLGYTAFQVRIATAVSRGQFLLELEKMLTAHEEVHLKLRPGGEWTGGKGPETAADWAKVEDYLGFFEHAEMLLTAKLIDWPTFQAIFSYRLGNILANRTIVEEKLQQQRSSWAIILQLLKRAGLDLPPAP